MTNERRELPVNHLLSVLDPVGEHDALGVALGLASALVVIHQTGEVVKVTISAMLITESSESLSMGHSPPEHAGRLVSVHVGVGVEAGDHHHSGLVLT